MFADLQLQVPKPHSKNGMTCAQENASEGANCESQFVLQLLRITCVEFATLWEAIYSFNRHVKKTQLKNSKQHLISISFSSLLQFHRRWTHNKTWATMLDKPRAKLRSSSTSSLASVGKLVFFNVLHCLIVELLKSLNYFNISFMTFINKFLCNFRKRLAAWWIRLAMQLSLLKNQCNRLFR